jgi:hypothetical protein
MVIMIPASAEQTKAQRTPRAKCLDRLSRVRLPHQNPRRGRRNRSGSLRRRNDDLPWPSRHCWAPLNKFRAQDHPQRMFLLCNQANMASPRASGRMAMLPMRLRTTVRHLRLPLSTRTTRPRV